MKRSDISGFEFTVCGYTFEVVTNYHRPTTLAIWKHTKLIKRFGK